MASALNALRFQYRSAIVDPKTGTATKALQDFMNALVTAIQTSAVIDLKSFGPSGEGGDDTGVFQKAIDTAVKQGGGVVFMESGLYKVQTLTVPIGTSPITFMGQGESTVITRYSDLAAGKGMFDIFGSNITFDSFVVDGLVTVAKGLFYNTDFNTQTTANDPMAPALTLNTSVWIHGPATNFMFQRMTFTHTGGYAILLDAGSGQLTDVQIFNCEFHDNRPHLFGATTGTYANQAIFGSWTGGVYVNGDGRAANPGCVLKRLLISQCRWLRNTGNCFWSHLYGLDELHEDFQITDNYFLDCGLDGILIGGVTGGAVTSNVFRRIGYTTLTDTDKAVPRWLPNLQATALDSSGLVKGVLYANNSFMSINGGCLDLDGHGDSAIAGNVCRVPYPDEPEYDEDSIAISGPNNNGSYSYGVNLGNTNNTPYGGRNVSISANTFINLPGGSVRLYSARDCHVIGNNIVVPPAPFAPPIAMGPGGPGANQRSTGNVVRDNRFEYSPAMAAPCVFEDPSVEPFVAGDVNYIFGNCPIVGNGSAVEFQKDPNSGSPTYQQTVWFT